MAAPKGHKPYNVNGEGGRPAIYTDEFINNEADLLMEWMETTSKIYFNSFAVERGYSKRRMEEWVHSNERFARTYEIAKDWQEQRLLQGATTKEYDGGFTKFVLINNHGYADKTETKVTGNANDPMHFMFSLIDGKTNNLVDDGEEK